MVKSGTCWRYLMLQLHPSRCWNVARHSELQSTFARDLLSLPDAASSCVGCAVSVVGLVDWSFGEVVQFLVLRNWAEQFLARWCRPHFSPTQESYLRWWLEVVVHSLDLAIPWVTPHPPRRTRKMTYLSYPTQGLRRAGRLGNLT